MNAPRFITWIVAVVLGVAGILAKIKLLSFLPASVSGLVIGNAFWFVVAAFVLLAIGTLLPGI